jgi:hypothetical protein
MEIGRMTEVEQFEYKSKDELQAGERILGRWI